MNLLTCIRRTSPFPILGVLGGIFHFIQILIQHILLANSENPDQTPHSVVSDLGLHCLLVSHKKDALQMGLTL